MFGLMISGFLVQGSRNNVIDRTARTCQPEDRGQKRSDRNRCGKRQGRAREPGK